MDKELLKASWVRAYRSFLQGIIAQIPAGFVITPAMIQYFKIGYIYVILAILANAALYATTSFATCLIGGLPEVNTLNTLYALDNDPENEPDEEDDMEDIYNEAGLPESEEAGEEGDE